MRGRHVVAVDGERDDHERVVHVLVVDALGDRARFGQELLGARARQRLDDARRGKLDELRRQAIPCTIDRRRVEQSFGDELLDERLAPAWYPARSRGEDWWR